MDGQIYNLLNKFGFSDGSAILEEEISIVEKMAKVFVDKLGIIEEKIDKLKF